MCGKGELCGETEQRWRVEFEVVDNLLRRGPDVSFRVRDAEHVMAAGSARPLGNHTFRLGWNVSVVGSVTMELFVDGQEADNSPVWVRVRRRTCPSTTQPLFLTQTSLPAVYHLFRSSIAHRSLIGVAEAREAANDDGECECVRSTVRLNGRCVELTTLVLPLAAGVLVALLVCIVRYYRHKIRHSTQQLWLIDHHRVAVADPPEVLGWGSYCEVVKASYQSTEVAVKRILRDRPDHPLHPRTQGPSGLAEARLQQAKRLSAVRESFPDSRQRHGSDLVEGYHRNSSVGRVSPRRQVLCPRTGALADDSEPGASVKADLEIALHVGVAPHEGGDSPVTPLSDPASLIRDSATRQLGKSEMRDGGGGLFLGMRPSSAGSSARKISSEGAGAGGSRPRAGGHMEEEIQLLASLRHPNITTLMGAIKDRNEYMMVMEFMLYGSLFDLYSNDMFELEGPILHPILLDVASGMVFLHSADPPIVHGDLKSSNILVDEKLRAKIADFGLASSKPKRGEGSLPWLAPELLRGGASSRAGDAYAFGVLLSEVLTRRLPYEGEELRGVLADVADEGVKRRPELPHNCPMMVQMIMQSCWESDPALRLGFDSIRGILAAVRIEQYPSKPKPMQTGDAMVYDMFPRHVADALMRGQSVPEDRRECATVFFSDICGFTDISATLETHQVAAMLDRLFSAMDAAAAAHGIYKVETIGDCYIGVSNLVESQPDDHASRMAAFSIDAMAAARRTRVDESDESKGTLQIRAGFDSGPIVGSVVGTTYKKYTIFGNTVNTASRMESTGVPGRIQCTERAAELLEKERRGVGENFEVVERGEVHVKGRGAMTTFFVNAVAPS